MRDWMLIAGMALCAPAIAFAEAADGEPGEDSPPSTAAAGLQLEPFDCPAGTAFKQTPGLGGIEQYCHIPGKDGDSEVRQGPYKRWTTNGKLMTIGHFEKGKKHGEWTDNHPDGSKALVSHYENDRLEGPWKAWDSKGNPVGEGEIVKGTGPWGEWHPNGKQKVQGQYKDGKMDGPWTWWYRTGRKKQEGRYEMDWQKGEWTTWFPNGNILSKGHRDIPPVEIQKQQAKAKEK